MKKLDKILIFVVLLVAALLMEFNYFKGKAVANSSKELIAEITVKGKVYKELKLSKEKQQIIIETELGKNIVSIHDKGIEIIDASCHDHICQKSGFINKPGKMIVCLPNKVSIKIKGNLGEDIDAVSK